MKGKMKTEDLTFDFQITAWDLDFSAVVLRG